MKYSFFVCAAILSILCGGRASALVKLIDCPEQAPEKFVILKATTDTTKDGNKCVQLSSEAAKQSLTIKNMIQDLGGDESIPIPMLNMNNIALQDIATLMEEGHERGDDGINRYLITIEMRNKGEFYVHDIIQVIQNANVLDLESVLHKALRIFSRKIFEEDAFKLAKWTPTFYKAYQKKVLQSMPPEVQRLMIQRSGPLFQPLERPFSKGPHGPLAISPDGKTVLTGSRPLIAQGFHLWDAKILRTKQEGDQIIGPRALPDRAGMPSNVEVTAVAFSSDGQQFLAGNRQGVAQLWDLKPSRFFRDGPLATFKHSGAGVNMLTVAFSVDGRRILSASTDGLIKVWDSSKRGDVVEPLVTFKNKTAVNSVAFSSDGKHILVASDKDRLAKLWDASSSEVKLIATFKHGGEVLTAAFSPDGKYIVTGSTDLTAKLWDSYARGDDVKPLATFKHGRRVDPVAFSQDGKYIGTGASLEGRVSVWGANSRGDDVQPLAILIGDAPLWRIVFAPGNTIVTVRQDGSLTFWTWLDTEHLSLAAAQIVHYALEKKLTPDKLPPHLLQDLDENAKIYLFAKKRY